MIQLSDEGIGVIACEFQAGILETGEVGNLCKAIKKAQLKKVGDWGNEECFDHPFKSRLKSEEYNRKRHRCPECWQILLEETK